MHSDFDVYIVQGEGRMQIKEFSRWIIVEALIKWFQLSYVIYIYNSTPSIIILHC